MSTNSDSAAKTSGSGTGYRDFICYRFYRPMDVHVDRNVLNSLKESLGLSVKGVKVGSNQRDVIEIMGMVNSLDDPLEYAIDRVYGYWMTGSPGRPVNEARFTISGSVSGHIVHCLVRFDMSFVGKRDGGVTGKAVFSMIPFNPMGMLECPFKTGWGLAVVAFVLKDGPFGVWNVRDICRIMQTKMGIRDDKRSHTILRMLRDLRFLTPEGSDSELYYNETGWSQFKDLFGIDLAKHMPDNATVNG